MDSLYIVMPAYNEAANISEVVHEWYPVVERHHGDGKSRLVVFNDGSKDDTLAVLQGLKEGHPYLEIVDKPNSGHGDTLLFAYQYALQRGADYIFQTDSDGQTRPNEFEAFWQARQQHPVVIGYRNHREDGFSRVVVTKVLKLVLYLIFRLHITDANTPFRLMRRDVLATYLPDVPPHFNLTNVMLTVLFLYNEVDVSFKTITFRPRQGGVNSINLPRISRIGIHAVKDFYTIRKHMHRHKVEHHA